MPYIVFFLLLLTTVNLSTSQESAQYLHNVMRDLKELKDTTKSERIQHSLSTLAEIFSTTSAPQAYIDRRIHQNEIPELSLTKGELASLYNKAVSKGHTVQLDTGDETIVNAALHELDSGHEDHSADDHHDSEQADETGYYYYYYPIKTFFNEISSHYSDEQQGHKSAHHAVTHVKPKPNYNYHKHTHQHNVKISSTKASTGEEKKNKLEPLFMAISGFLGMAVMFVLSVLVLPKFGAKRPKPKGKHDLGDIARIALQAIEGQDCRERFACELSKTARSLNLHENRFVRLFWRVAPTSLSKKFSRVNKYSNKQMKCTAIPCKRREPTPKPNHKNNRKKMKKS